MLGKLFRSKKAPTNNGDLIGQSHISNLRLKKVFELELVNMEGSPCYRLSNKLGFGSEIGEVLIAEESISPRHCTFSLEQDVITLIDHNSVNGTFVNDVKIEPGKSLILDERDEIRIGELLIKIKTHNEAIVREKKASLATLPDAAISEPELVEEETAENGQTEEKTEDNSQDDEILNQLNDSEDKFQDDTNLAIDPNINQDIVDGSQLLESKGIRIEDLVITGKHEIREDRRVEEEQPEPFFDEDNPEEILVDELLDEEEDEEEEVLPERTSVFIRLARKLKPKKKKKKSFRNRTQESVLVQKYAANTILRLVALHIDLCLAYGTYLLISPFDDFKNLVNLALTQSKEVLELVSQSPIYQTYKNDVSFIFEMVQDLWTVIDTYINPVPTLVVFVVSKLIFNLLIGMSLGQMLVGMKADGNFIWKRVGGLLRTIIGFITFPFFIFDLSAVISRRTFKEIITFTRLYSDSKFLNILFSIIFIAVSGLYVLMAPMFQGFEAVARYEIPAKVEERVRIQETENLEEESSQIFSSQFLGFKVDLTKEFSLFPGFKFEGSGKKTNSQFILNVFDKNMQGSAQVEVLKTFDLKQLLEIGFKGNPFLKLRFPHIDNYIHQHTPVGFKRSVLDSDAYAQEFMEFHRMAMDMSIESYFDYIHEVPLVNSLLNYKQSFLSLFENTQLGSMSFIKIGNIFALKVSQDSPGTSDYIIPIIPEGKIFKISFQGEKIPGVASRFYRYALYQSDWTSQLDMTAFDRILKALKEGQEIGAEDAQALYGLYYELSQKVISEANEEEYQLLKKVVKSVHLLLEGLNKDNSEALQKLESNFKDLMDAIEMQNREYFNLSETTIL